MTVLAIIGVLAIVYLVVRFAAKIAANIVTR